MVERPFIFAITGGSGSGKTTYAKRILAALGDDRCSLLTQDSYYLDQSALFKDPGGEANFDHPDSLDFGLLAAHLYELREGHPVEAPSYDRSSHTRRKEFEYLPIKSVLIVDGIHILSQPKVRIHLDASLFLDVPETIRFERRLRRDVAERGRTPEQVRNQWNLQVQPMHERFVEPSKAYATWITCDESRLSELVEALRLRAGA